MRKLWFFILMAASVLLAACSSSTGTPTPPPAAKSASTNPTQTAAPTHKATVVEMTCRVVSMIPTPGPTEVSSFPAPGEQDWILGKEGALLTITEYSDFQ